MSYRSMEFQNSDVDDRDQIKPGEPTEQIYNLDNDVGQNMNLAAS